MIQRFIPALLVVAGFANVAAAEVRDHAKIFKPETVTEANSVIKEIQSRFHHPVTIETFAELPKEKLPAFEKAKNRTERAKFYKDWLQERAKASNARGVYVLICMKPGHVEVVPDDATRRKDFTLVDAEDLDKQMAQAFADKKYDDGLLAGVESIRTAMLAHQRLVDKPAVAKPSSNPTIQREPEEKGWSIMGFLCLIAGIVMFFWVVMGLIRAFTGAGRSMSGPAGMGPGQGMGGPGYVGGGGGGFMSNFMGGMFGAVAGSWLYNNMFGGGGHHMAGGGWDSPAIGGDRGDFDHGRDGDFSGPGAGADFGDAGGGAGGDFGNDFGGGDFSGGGDFGGGDFGGGGDF